MTTKKEHGDKPVVIVDGSSYLFRAYHALPELTNKDGQATGAIYGVVNMMKRLTNDYKDHPVVVVFDSKGKTTRHEYFPDYKANRPDMPDDLASQIPYIHEFIKSFGMPLIMEQGIEADDIIGTLAKQYANQGRNVIISTGDKDMAQLVNEKVNLVNTMTESELDIEGVIKKFGVPPEKIIDYLALMGDKIDNIPGIPKVGPKTAAKWLDAYGSMENLMEHADEIKGKVGENLREHMHQLPISKRLTTIDCDLDLKLTDKDLEHTEEDTENLRKLYQQLGFNRWLKTLESKDQSKTLSEASSLDNLEIIKTDEAWQACFAILNKAEQISFIIQGTSDNPLDSQLQSMAFQTDTNTYLVELEQYDLLSTNGFCLPNIKDDLNKLLAKKKTLWLMHDSKFYEKFCHTLQLNYPENIFDTMLASYILRELTGKQDLQSCAKYWLSDSVLMDPTHQKNNPNHLAHACEIITQLHKVLNKDFADKKKAKQLYTKMSLPISNILAHMEIAGVLLNTKLLEAQSQSIGKELETLKQNIYKLSGEEFKVESPKQLGYILFEKLELPIIKKTPTGAPSTAEPVLVELAEDYELPKLIMEYRSLSKLKTTYTDKLPHEVNPKTHRVHTTYLQTGTSTGRLASINPNLQNIPIRTERGREVRLAFVAPEGHKLVAADYSQIELRIMADLSKDKNLLAAFNSNEDVHRHTAATVLNIKPEDVSFEQRRQAKAVNFGLMYGMSAFGLSKQLGIERGEAQKFIDLYFASYPGIREYMDKTYELAKKQGYVETLFGRRIAVPNINSSNHIQAAAAKRAAINAPLQGSAADIIKQAMINFENLKTKNNLTTTMIMQVHDELVFQVPDSELKKAKEIITSAMESAFKLSVPLLISLGEGNNWQEAH